MSYLPRMSSTYKEPEALNQDDSEELQPTNSIQIASSLINEKSYNPQTALKHYKYHPHPLPVLPGPSVVDEANENELLRESSKMKRSTSLIDDINLDSSKITITSKTANSSQVSIHGSKALSNIIDPVSSTQINVEKTNKISQNKNKGSVLGPDKKNKSSNQTINICLVHADVPESFVEPQNLPDCNKKEQSLSEFFAKSKLSDSPNKNDLATKVTLNPSKSANGNVKSSQENQTKNLINRGVQCAIFGGAEKTFVIPSMMKTLLKTLAFLLYEINKDDVLYCFSTEGKRLMTQIQLILGDLCNQDVNENFRFDVTYSDLKRVEKLLEGLKKYIKSTYGSNEDILDVSEKLKNLFFELKIKELELSFLNDRIYEKELFQTSEKEIIENELKNPEVTLQNKKLECEQLLAQVEFSNIEIKKCQKALAEADWEIKNGHDRMKNLKKSSGSKFRMDNLRRKSSVQKFVLESPKKIAKKKILKITE